MADGEERRKKKKGGLFGRKKKKKDPGETSFNSDADSNGSGRRKKNRGIGRRIQRIVGGRKRNKKSGDDASGISFLDKDDPNYKGPRTHLDPSVLAQITENEDPNGMSRDPYGPGGVGGPLQDAIEEETDDDDLMSYGEVDDGAADDEPGDLMLPVALVLLLVDPETLRFELLQLDLENPQEAKVSDVLDQIKESVTEPAIQALEFHSLVDRKGGQFSASTALAKALTNRKRSKDILVGLSKGVTTEHCGRLARPILGDSKVIGMLQSNGYSIAGWAKLKEEESELKDATLEKFAILEQKRQLRLTVIILGGLLAVYFVYVLLSYFFGSQPLVAVIKDAAGNETLAETTLEGVDIPVDIEPEVA